MCGDSLGEIKLMEKNLSLSRRGLTKIITRLVKKGLIKKYEKEGWYDATEKGKKYLRENFNKIIEDSVKIIMNFSLNEIDEFWFSLGWVDSERGKNKSLSNWRIRKIRQDKKFARISIKNLLLESDINDFLDKLEK